MSGDVSFWLGLALAVPIGVGVNLLTPAIAKQLGKFNDRARRKDAQIQADEKLLADWLSQNPDAFTFFEISFRATRLVTEIIGMACLVAGLLMSAVKEDIWIGYSLLWIGLLCSLLASRAYVRYHKIRKPVMQRFGWPNSLYSGPPKTAAAELRRLGENSDACGG